MTDAIDPISYNAGIEAAEKWPEPKVTNPDIADPTGIPYIDCLIHRLLDAQQDINYEANTHMSQSLCDAAALIDEVETTIRRLAARSLPAPATDGEAEKLAERIERHINLMARTSMHLSLEQWGDIANDMLAAASRLRSPQWRKNIPDHLFWLIGKGRTRPTEPLYACQIIDPESGVAIAEAEHEELDQAVAKAVAAIPSRLRSQDRKDV